MAGITDDIIKAAKEFDVDYKKGKTDVDALKKQYITALNNGKKLSNELRDAGMALDKRRKVLEDIIDRAEGHLKTAAECADEFDMLARKAADAEKYLNQMRKDEKANAQRFKAGATDKKIKLEAEAFEKALDKAERDYRSLEGSRAFSERRAKDPLEFFRLIDKENWEKNLAEYIVEQRKFNSSLEYFNRWSQF